MHIDSTVPTVLVFECVHAYVLAKDLEYIDHDQVVLDIITCFKLYLHVCKRMPPALANQC
jgi:hypothetical protein